MTLPSNGPISMGQVRTELGLSGAISLGSSNVRTLAGKTSGAISLSNLHGKSYVPPTNAYTYTMVGGASGGGVYGYTTMYPVYGSLSPTTYSGYTIYSIELHPTSIGIGISTNSVAVLNTIKSITIGGIRILISNRSVDTKYNLSGVSGSVTTEQYNAITSAIYNKTSTVLIEYF